MSADVDTLRVDAVSAVPFDVVSYSDRYNPVSGVYEAVYCEKCHDLIFLSPGEGNCKHYEVDTDTGYAILPPCDFSGHHGIAGPCEHCTDSTGPEGVGLCMCKDAKCDGWVPLCEGPASTWFYPIPGSDWDAYAKAVAHLPICILELHNGDLGFALTGGGMDLSWELAGAYVACGYLPPSELRLPRMGGLRLTGWRSDVFKAMRRSIEVHQNWLSNASDRLRELEEWVEDQNAKHPTEESTT